MLFRSKLAIELQNEYRQGGQLIENAVQTNGTLLDDEWCEFFAANKFLVGVSLDGLSETNNSFRGSGDAYSNALQGMRNLRDAGIKTGLRFTITRLNCHELPQIMELLVKEGFHRLCVYHLEYAGRGRELMNNDLSPDERRRAVDDLFRKTVEINRHNHDLEVLTVGNYADAAYIYMKVLKEDPQKARAAYEHFLRNGGEGCGEKLAYIDEVGNVYASQHLKTELGNIRERSLKDIWSSDNEFLWKLRHRERLLRGRCAECRFLEICRGGSRARALAVYDDFGAPDPSCYLTEEEISTLLATSPNWLRNIIVAAINTGMRLSEILNLKWQDVHDNYIARPFIELKKTKKLTKTAIKITETMPLNNNMIELFNR